MQIKTIEALTMKDAMTMVKRELGPDAVLLSSKEKQVPGRDQTFIEVTAASFRPEAAADKLLQAPAAADRQQMAELRKTVERIDQRLTASSFAAVEAGITDLKALLIEMLDSGSSEDLKVPPSFVKVYYQLKVMGVSEALIRGLLNRMPRDEAGSALPAGDDGAAEKVQRDRAIKAVYQSIKIHSGIKADPERSSISVFLGASGAGRTTLVAKLAGRHKLQKAADVQIISLKAGKVGADEVLRTYARIIDCGFQAAASVEELKGMLTKVRPGSVVLVDTPALSARERLEEELLTLSKSPLPIEFHLVAPLTEKNVQIDRTIARASRLGIESLCFTKLDEAQTFGEIYNLCSKWSIPLSYLSVGEGIPEDVEKATKERVIQKIFGID